MSIICIPEQYLCPRLIAKSTHRPWLQLQLQHQLQHHIPPSLIRRSQLVRHVSALSGAGRGARQPSGSTWKDPRDAFISALVRAGSCKRHSTSSSALNSTNLTPTIYRTKDAEPGRHSQLPRRINHATAQKTSAAGLYGGREVSRGDYLSLVDFYNEPLIPQSNRLAPSKPQTVIPVDSNIPDRLIQRSRQAEVLARDEGYGAVVDRLDEALRDEETSHSIIFELYRSLPGQRITHLPPNQIRLLLQRLSVVERKSEMSMLRFLSVIDDMKAADIPIEPSEWTSAIAFAGRCFANVSETAVESALHIFKEMEADAGVKGDAVTFNILFDMAAKAGKYVLAEMILDEMQNRGLELGRFGHVGLIFYYGLRHDGEGVRQAYTELVEAGEIVDTVVMNCVLTSLITAGEGTAAEEVYGRMKRLHAERIGAPLPPQEWRDARQLGKALRRASAYARTNPKRLKELEDRSSIAPNLRTYRILTDYYAKRTGNLEQLAMVLNDMPSYRVPLDGSIFRSIFRGFTRHGGVRCTAWTSSRLESVWSAYTDALDHSDAGVVLSESMISWALRAFGKCAGRERTLEVWAEAQRRWQPGAGELDIVCKTLQSVLTNCTF